MEARSVGHGALRAGVHLAMDDGIIGFEELPEGVRPLHVRTEWLASAVLLVTTGVITITQFPSAPMVVLSTLVLSALLLRWTLRARTTGKLVAWCLIGSCVAGWLNTALGGALTYGVEMLPVGLIYGFFGLPYGLIYGFGFLLLLLPFSKIDASSPDAGERAVIVASRWLAATGLLFALVPPVWPIGNDTMIFDPNRWRIVGAVGFEIVAAGSWAFARLRLARRRRWIAKVKSGEEPGWCTVPAGIQHGGLSWLTPRIGAAVVVARRIDGDGVYRAGTSRPVALVADT